MRGWNVAITTKPRGHVEIDNGEDEAAYQADEMSHILSITEVERLDGLVDQSLNQFEKIVDPLNQPPQGEDEDQEEDAEEKEHEDTEEEHEDVEVDEDEYDFEYEDEDDNIHN